jgi:hypothetical protein
MGTHDLFKIPKGLIYCTQVGEEGPHARRVFRNDFAPEPKQAQEFPTYVDDGRRMMHPVFFYCLAERAK